jgi:hypothetical protein
MWTRKGSLTLKSASPFRKLHHLCRVNNLLNTYPEQINAPSEFNGSNMYNMFDPFGFTGRSWFCSGCLLLVDMSVSALHVFGTNFDIGFDRRVRPA